MLEWTRPGEVVGLDDSLAMAAVASDRGAGPRYVAASAERVPFADQRFDLVAFVTSLEFVADPAAALREASRIARYGLLIGAVVTLTPVR